MKFGPRTAYPAFGKPDCPCVPPSVVSAASVVKSPNLGSFACPSGLCPHPAILNSLSRQLLAHSCKPEFSPNRFSFNRLRTLPPKHPGWGPSSQVRNAAPSFARFLIARTGKSVFLALLAFPFRTLYSCFIPIKHERVAGQEADLSTAPGILPCYRKSHAEHHSRSSGHGLHVVRGLSLFHYLP